MLDERGRKIKILFLNVKICFGEETKSAIFVKKIVFFNIQLKIVIYERFSE